jgi:predicted nucleic acid-binding protein
VIVLDASAVVDVVADQREKHWVLEQMTGQTLSAPAHQIAEVLSAIARLGRQGVLEQLAQQDAVNDALGLEQELVLPTPAHVLRALDLADNVRVLDGLYVALAEERACPLVTTDRRLARGMTGIDVRTPG